ncbi:MAG: bifunctional metallophosphatase/5'-nucleotidase [Oscillibacter sp.]|nr:bifunctional metallophosphatase/5'-nucleotidase [Oscillibacter sp.]
MRKWNKLLALLLAMVMAFSLAATGLAEEGAAEEVVPAFEVPEGVEGAIVIIHTNDVHGAVEGYAKVAALKAMYEAAGAQVLLVDAGDFSQGTTYVSVSEGATAIELMNLAGYDVAAPGNHEFDYGYANLKTLEEKANFPILAANITYEGEAALGTNKIFELDGAKVGIFGLDTPETATKAHPGKIKGVSFAGSEDLYAVAQAQVDELKAAGCDLVICLGHLGIDDESAANGNRSIDMLAEVTGIDVLIDGHSHSTLEQVKAATNGAGKVGDTYVTSTGTKIANVGVVTIKGDEITTENVNAEAITVAEGDAIAARAAEIVAEIEAEYGATFATSTVKLNGDRDPGNRTEETNLGDLITDAMVWYVTKDGDDLGVPTENVIAITNGGGIRASIEAGDISKKDVNTVLPFGNSVAYVTVTGEALLEMLEASTFCTPTAVGGFPQVSGIDFTINIGQPYDEGELYPDTTYNAPASISRVTVNSVNGKEFDPEADYVVITNDFTAAGGDTYYALSESENIVDTGLPLDEALMQYITEVLEGTVSDKYAEPAGRINIAGFTDVQAGSWYYEHVMAMYEEAVVNGYGDHTFLPDDSVTWGQALKMVITYVTGEGQAPVEGGGWASGYVAYAKENGLIDGDVDINANITRVEICQVLAKALELGASEEESNFPDTDDGYVMALVELGVINGNPDGTFAPDQDLTRAAVCKMLNTIPAEVLAA